MDELIISPEARAVIEDDALKSYPNESFGFLFGYEDQQRVVTLAIEVEQLQMETDGRLSIPLYEYDKAAEFASENHLAVLGIYHSRPDHAAIPSDQDLKRAIPWYSYVIVSMKKRKVAAMLSWKLSKEGRFEEEKITYKEHEINVEHLLMQLSEN